MQTTNFVNFSTTAITKRALQLKARKTIASLSILVLFVSLFSANPNTVLAGGNHDDHDSHNHNPHLITPAADPELDQTCGLDIALVLDNSDSITAGNLAIMKNDFNHFVNTLSVTPTEFSVTYFGTVGHVQQTFTANMGSVHSAINSVPNGQHPVQYTNWEDGLLKAQSTFDPRSNPNLVIFASDGNPNTIGTGPANNAAPDGSIAALNPAITQANSIKASGTRIITLGIGSNVNQANLEMISDTQANHGYFSAAHFSDLSATLQDIVTDLCGGTINVHKVIDADGNPNTTNDQTNGGAGWVFTVAGQAGMTTDATGTVSKSVTNNGPYSVTETSGAVGYSFVTASCYGSSGNNGYLNNNTISGITVSNSDVVTCKFINAPMAGTLHVIKQVVGGDAVASDFTLHVSYGSPSQFPGSTSGTDVTVPAGSSYAVTESASDNYSQDTSAAGCSGIMPANGHVTCTVVNTFIPPVDNTASLTVTKVVTNDNGGTSVVADFVLSVNSTPVTSGSVNTFDPGTYTVSEGAHAGYTSTISGDCAADGTITLASGDAKACTITNNDITGTLSVKKIVVGGTATPDQFSFAVNDGTPVVFNANGTNNLSENVGTYTVTEPTVDANYSASFDNCSAVVIALGQTTVCTITNTFNSVVDNSGTLTVKKIVQGSDASPSDFAFTVNGGESNQFEADGQNDLQVAPGTYTVTEVAVDGYTTTYSNCSEVVITTGGTSVCTITNTIPSQGGGEGVSADLGIDKTVDQAHPTVGTTVVYTLVVKNAGPDVATNSVVTDNLPNDLVFVSSSADQGTYDADTNLWTIGTLTLNQTVTLTIHATVTSSDTITNTASVTAAQTDPNLTNNQDSVDVTAPFNQCNGNCGGGGGGGGGSHPQNPPPSTPVPTPTPPVTQTPPPGQVAGAVTPLPRTGDSATYVYFLMLLALLPLAYKATKKA